jgi:CRP-like cAMP-binding protein
MDIRQYLRSAAIFAGVGESVLAEISSNVKEVKLSSGNEIFNEGDSSDSFYIIGSGTITIFKRLAPGKEKTLAELTRGNFFGETALFSETSRTANAATKSDSILLKIDKDQFKRILDKTPKEGIKIFSGLLQTLTQRLEQTSRELATVYRTGKVISSGSNIEDVIDSIKEELILAIPEADEIRVFLYNEYNVEYCLIPCDGKTEEVGPKDPLILTIKNNPSGIVVNDASMQHAISGRPVKGFSSYIIAPIMKSEFMQGFFILGSMSKKYSFKNSYALLLLSVGEQLAEAIENIKYRREAKDRRRLEESKGLL